MLEFDSKTSTDHGLNKNHKSDIIQTLCNENNAKYIQMFNSADLQLRPIVAGPHCKSSHFVVLLIF
jgi:hypothetical protein